jgi:hypothetical protein
MPGATWIVRLSLALSVLLGFGPHAGAQDHNVRGSPFDGLRWEGDEPEVLIGTTWYRPVSLDGLVVADICTRCEEEWPGKMKKRFGEDLVEALVLMGWEGDLSVDLELVRIADGESVRLSGVEMTNARRNAIKNASSMPRLRPPAPSTLTRAKALADLEQLELGLRDQFAYLETRGVDLEAELKSMRAGLGEEVPSWDFARSVQRLMMSFGDGHASARGPAEAPREWRYLPFLLERTSAGITAFRPDRGALLDAEHPVLVKLDGLTPAEWVEVLRPFVAAGSPQLVERRALGDLRELDLARRLAGLDVGVPIELTLASARGDATVELTLEPTRLRPTYGPWPRTAPRVLDGGIGYLPIREMNSDVDGLRGAMDAFRETRGLVVDVRGNGGGSRDLLLALAGYLVGVGDPAWVGNVAAYRTSMKFGADHLDARFMHRADWRGWSERQRDAIAQLAPGFEPEWELPSSGFSEWHYLVLDRTGDPAEYHYDRPVVLLSNSRCFSATDIFLGALEVLPAVTLVGEASSGGSARSQDFRLAHSGISVRCASMASFRPDGRLYDGRGVEVDLAVLPEPGDLLHEGGDAQLEAALLRLD